MTETVTLTTGRLAGVRQGAVRVFLGIPYAAPPVGDRRFAAPRPPDPWTGVRAATGYGPACPQPPIRQNLVIAPEVEAAMFGLADEPKDEDCLSLNVWVPAAPAEPPGRPVMVSFHGGGFKSGSGSARSAPWFDGSRLAAGGDVVVVTVNHRIGVLGHLAIKGREGSGNVGLLDLVAALEWVRDNISAFGGDPGRVTIFGESGGGGKVMALLGIRRAAGLFHRAISQSGTLAWLTAAEAAEVGDAIASAVGLGRVSDLVHAPLDALIAAALEVTRRGMQFAPVYDDVVLSGPVVDALAAGSVADVPLIIGFTRHEATAFLQRPAEIGQEAWWDLVRERTDAMFRAPALAAARARARFGGAPAFVYEFAWETPVLDGSLRAAHGVDVAFPFDNTDRHPATSGSPSAPLLAGMVRDAWVSFARTGDPNHGAMVTWPRVEPRDGQMLVLDEMPHVQALPGEGGQLVDGGAETVSRTG